jgi:hypothetical protein
MVGDSQEGKHPVVAVNDTREKKSGTVAIRDADTGETLFTSSFDIPANGKTAIGFIRESNKQSMWLIDYSINNEKYANHYLAGEPPFKLTDYERWYKKLKITKD